MNIEITETWTFKAELMSKPESEGGPEEWAKCLITDNSDSHWVKANEEKAYVFLGQNPWKPDFCLEDGDVLAHTKSGFVLHFNEQEWEDLDLDREFEG